MSLRINFTRHTHRAQYTRLAGRAVLTAAALAAALPASAAVTFYDSMAGFLGASTSTLQATFEGFSTAADTPGIANPYTEGSVTFAHPSNLYIAVPGGAAATLDFDVAPTSNVLTVSGNEDIAMSFGGPAPTAVGFTSITNQFAAPVVGVYDTANLLIGSYVLTQGPATIGFVGITSSVAIGRVQWVPTSGGVKDTALDNIYVGQVPEPSTWVLMLAGTALLLLTARRRRAAQENAR